MVNNLNSANKGKLEFFSKPVAATSVNLSLEQIEHKWQDIASNLSSTLQGHEGHIPESVAPFDAASDIPVDEQK